MDNNNHADPEVEDTFMEENNHDNPGEEDTPGQNQQGNQNPADKDPPTVLFALTPAAANPGIIDYTLVEGRKMKESSTKKLTEDPFDCVPEELFIFLKAFKGRARDCDWNGGNGILDIIRVPENISSPSDDLLEAYGSITIDAV